MGYRSIESNRYPRHRAVRRMMTPQALLAIAAVLAMMVAIIPASGSTAAGPPIYPDLRTAPPSNLYLELGGDGQWRLRFANTVSNYGGPLEITVDSTKRIYQNVYDALSGGNLVSSTRVGSDIIFHPTHNHFHFADFARYDLLVRDARGAYRGSRYQSQKTTFCIIDYIRVNAPGPSTPGYTTCGSDVQGLSAGWGDTYTADLPDQWMMIGSSPLADGEYAIRSIADPFNKLRESDESNNEGFVYFSVVNGQLESSGELPICTSDPAFGKVGDVVTLTCSRFDNGEPVDIRWGGPSTTPLQTVTASSGGDVTAYVTIPDGGSGNHYIIATGQSSELEAAAIFNTRPGIWRQYWNRTVGSPELVVVTGFSPFETVQIEYAVSPGSNVVVGSLLTDSKGGGSMSFDIPVSQIGRHDIIAIGTRSGLSDARAVNVNPSALALPEVANAGGSTGVSLRGFAAYEYVAISIDGTSIGQVRASSTGSTTASRAQVELPSTLQDGHYELLAVGQSSGGAASTPLEISGVAIAAEETAIPATPEPEETMPATPEAIATETPPDGESTPGPSLNEPPVADAGDDQTVTDLDGDGFADVQLDAGASTDPEGGALSARWTVPDGDDPDLDDDVLSDELKPEVRLPVGVTTVTLIVTDDFGQTAIDEIQITILAAPTPTPTADVEDIGTPAP